jgi:peptidoglycan lytic transglycosylase B
MRLSFLIRLLPAALLAVAAGSMLAPARPAEALDTQRADVTAFIDRVAARDGFDTASLERILRAAQSQPAILAAMERPAEKTMTWREYRPLFLNERRIQEGVDFWNAHRRDLEDSSRRTGVPAEYVAAILGVETYYGRLTGRYRVLDALATLSFDYPPRAAYFRGELEQFLLLARDQGIDPLTALGSYAGAMGAPQFMPSAYRWFGLDASDDGRVDLWSDWPDVFDSVGYFLKEHGWTSGAPVLLEARVAAGRTPTPADADLRSSTTVGALRAAGVRIDGAADPDAPAWLIAADGAGGTEWRVGLGNFYAITRYNHSPLYAMAVHDLAVALAARAAGPAAPERSSAPLETAHGATAAAARLAPAAP